jgi:hypothetical protein
MAGFGVGGAVVGTSSGHPGATRRVEPLLRVDVALPLVAAALLVALAAVEVQFGR